MNSPVKFPHCKLKFWGSLTWTIVSCARINTDVNISASASDSPTTSKLPKNTDLRQQHYITTEAITSASLSYTLQKHNSSLFNSMVSTSLPRDSFSTPPPELLIIVIAEVPLKVFLDLKHTYRLFRDYLKENVSTICNYAIQSRFPYKAKSKNQFVSPVGWCLGIGTSKPCNTAFKSRLKRASSGIAG